jgi:surface antigen
VRGVVAECLTSARALAPCALIAGVAATLLAACSLTMPFEDRSAATLADADITGSITPRAPKPPELAPGQASPFSPKLDDEDWRRQKAALATALDPQGNGATVRWENGASGAKGAFSAGGDAYLVKDEICRAFEGGVTAGEPEQWFQGVACRVSLGEWAIKDVKPGRRPG